LLVDENRTVRYVLAQQLENWGVQVTQVDTIDQVTPNVTFDLMFFRQSEGMPAPRVARHIVMICEQATAPDTEQACISRPVDQSVLYNLLLQSIPPGTTSTDEMPDQQSHRGRILLAEDNMINFELVHRALGGIGFQVDHAENGAKALDQIQQAAYDLVLMDMQMPVMDGMEATRRIRALPAPYQSIPILALTASVMPDEREQFLALGVDDVISKPFSVRHLRQVVNQWLTDTV
jgi:two-component system, sensor histidine kinase SagS